MGTDPHTVFGQERIDDRQVAEIIGLAHGIIADGKVVQAEAEYLARYLDGRLHVTGNPVVRTLHDRVRAVLADGILDDEEAADLRATLTAFAGGDFADGELAKSTSLPLCAPPPDMVFPGVSMCFTGTFAFGRRAACEAAASARGAVPGTLTAGTRYLVIGTYATESWAQSSYGRKIEKAVDMRLRGSPIRIVGEAHWVAQMGRG